MALSTEDINRITSGIMNPLRDHIDSLVKDAVREIPYRIREYLDGPNQAIIREQIAKQIEGAMLVRVTLKGEEIQ